MVCVWLKELALAVVVLIIAAASNAASLQYPEIGSIYTFSNSKQLDLGGGNIRAWNIGGTEDARIRGVVFSRNLANLGKTGFSSVEQSWGMKPDYGSGADNVNLALAMSSAGCSKTSDISRISIRVIPGKSYRLQLLFSDNQYVSDPDWVGCDAGFKARSGPRRFDIRIDGRNAFDDFDPIFNMNAGGQSGATPRVGVVYKYSFTPKRDVLEISLNCSQGPLDGAQFVNAVTLSEVAASEAAACPDYEKRMSTLKKHLAGVKVSIKTGRTSMGEGETIDVIATAKLANGKSAVGFELLPFVNGKRWGAHEYTDSKGMAKFQIPIPRPGKARIKVLAVIPQKLSDDRWIWSDRQNGSAPAYIQKTFVLSKSAEGGALWFVSEQPSTVYVNGKKIAEKQMWWGANPSFTVPADALKIGVNVISIECIPGKPDPGINQTGGTGVLARLVIDTTSGKRTIATGAGWQVFAEKPAGWPEQAARSGQPATTYARGGWYLYKPVPWPGFVENMWMCSVPAPEMGNYSNTVNVDVNKRALKLFPHDPDHLIAAQWESWHTTWHAFWQTSQVVPLLGFYDQLDPDVARQHIIWLAESGVDVILGDWSNNIWFSETWETRAWGVDQLIQSFTVMMDELVRMREEGYPVPKASLLIGISWKSPKAVDGELAYIWNTYINNPKYKNLWQELDGKPLVQILDIAGHYYKQGYKLDDRFAVRYTAVDNEVRKLHEKGFWTWADFMVPQPTMRDGRCEAATVSFGCFGEGGWISKNNRGHRGGATIVEDWKVAMGCRPKFLLLHQFNEFFAGAEALGIGPKRNTYLDSYTAELCDDWESVSLTSPGFREGYGWGFYYHNMLRALVDMYKEKVPETSVVVISSPLNTQVITENKLKVRWVSVGVPASGYTITLNGKPVAKSVRGSEAVIDLSSVSDGRVISLGVIAQGTKTYFPLYYDREVARLAKPLPANASVEFILKRK